ncbi:MAG: M1 family metallopeptidase [Bacteroidetes bacterium]|nr:M1 family metallopeptidase [Bacteroidota bacterium]
MRDFFIYIFLGLAFVSFGQKTKYTHADSIKGKITKEREWWNVLHYDLNVSFNPSDSSIKGRNKITFKALTSGRTMQIDLQAPMVLDSVLQAGKKCVWKKDGDAYFVELNVAIDKSITENIITCFHGKPHVAKIPPWDGGLIWKKDKNKNPWISIACQGMAGSVWFPCKDHMYDEPDSTRFTIDNVPEGLVAVSNGRLKAANENSNGSASYVWEVKNPINNYNIIPYIGKYVHFSDTIMGEKGELKLNYWVLDYNLEKAKQQFKQTKSMLHCFEYWFGPYPFYEDEYKLVEAPHLGMEHQSAVAYGNGYVNGYMGRDLSLTGWGLKWDFIIVHESGHEWFGNNISVKDVADNWVHEGFTAYSENLYTEYLFGKKAGAEYVIGTRKSVLNDKPVIGDYEVNNDGSGDKYYKASNMLHTIRYILNNDSIWRAFLRDINKTFYHQTVSTKQLEEFMISYLKLDLQKVFDQYLRTTQIPVLQYKLKKGKLSYRWANCVEGFNMPLRINTSKGSLMLKPTTQFQDVKIKSTAFGPDENYYIEMTKIN